MTASTPPHLLPWDDVAVGDHLPTLVLPVERVTVTGGAAAARDWRPVHHDPDAARRAGLPDVLLDTPTQLAVAQRALTDWGGPGLRIARLTVHMVRPVHPGDRLVVAGSVVGRSLDDTGCGWVAVALTARVGEAVATTVGAVVALPTAAGDDVWARRGDAWAPPRSI